ncbi:MAG: ABC transporter permease [Pseudoxanthomonas suwonensis]|nr:ABC transporter permease [Pseudoxanthomonas suwonensis]
MKYLALIWSSLLRSKTRTGLTLMSVVTAFLLFGLLDSVRVVFNSGGGLDGSNRLVVASKLSITQMLPAALEREIAAVPGVRRVASGTWFGGIYQDARNFFPNFSISGNYLDLYPEYVIDPQQRRAWDNDAGGAVVGRMLADQYGWKPGDVIPLQATIFPNADGSNNWPLTIRAVFDVRDAKRRGEEQQLFMHWSYFNESNIFMKDAVSWYVVQLADPGQANAVAQAIDRISENSNRETKTQTEQAFNQAFAKQFADIGLIVTAIMGAVFFTLLLLTGNAMAQAVRERIPELAVLKTLGFTNRVVLWLVLAESVLLIVLGGLLGMGLARALIPVIATASAGMVPLGGIPGETWAMGLVLMLLIGLAVGLLPALRAMRLSIVDALAGR